MIDKMVDVSYDRRLHEKLEADDTDHMWRVYLTFPEDHYTLTCGANSKQTGQPCKNVSLYRNGRCKFHGGLSTGPKSKAGKRKAAANGKKGGRPKFKPDCKC